MDEKGLQSLFERFGVDDLQLRGEVREFAYMDPQMQLVYLFLDAKTRKQATALRGHIFNALYTTAAIAAGVYTAMGGKLPGIERP